MSDKSPGQSTSEAKSQLRNLAKAHRENSTPNSPDICAHLASFLEAVEGFVIVYDALAGEVDLSALWGNTTETEPQSGVRYAITRTPEKEMDLTIHPVGVEMENHRWGYRQPVAGAPQIPDHEVGAVLVPGLAFDLSGGRIGWGAGYYDRLLARLNPTALKIGVSDGFMVERVPMDDHDIPMTHVVSPDGVIAVSGS